MGADEDGQREPRARGRLEVGTAGRGALRWAVAEITGPVEEARRRLDLSPVAAAALGRTLAAAPLLLRLAAKTPQRLVVEVVGDGPLRKVVAEADSEGNLRGLVGDHLAAVPDHANGKLNVGAAVGRGSLRVLREQAGGGRYDSRVELVSGEIGEDVAAYLRQSEQVPSAVLLGVLTRPHGVAAAGGVVVEVLPGAGEEEVAQLEENVRRVTALSRLIEDGGLAAGKAAILDRLEAVVTETRELRYHCRCSRERLRRHLVLVARAGRDPLWRDDGRLDAECAFCGDVYEFEAHELEPGDELPP